MVDLIPDENPIKPLLRAIEPLAAYATTYRYPTSAGRIPATPSPERLKDWIDKVGKALDQAASRFAVALDAEDTPAERPGPLR